MWDRFLRACRCEAVDRTPVWFMRQAGRYMGEYRALRERYGILEIIRQPELSLAVTLQPVRAFHVDAAIVFADILPLLEGMGLELEFVSGKGPVIGNPIGAAADVARLADPPIEDSVPYTLEAVGLARAELAGRTPVIGFSGAPFTLACYAIEGGSSRDFERAKLFMFDQPEAWHELMRRLAERVGSYLAAQARAGADALQLFDSWAGALSPADYRAHVAPYTRHVLEVAGAEGVPVIHFGTGTAGMLDDFAAGGAHVVGVDWRVDLGRARDALAPDQAIQGNLDPHALLGSWESLRARADVVLEQAAGRNGHIFNVGHGILPATPPENVARLTAYIHGVSARDESHMTDHV